LLGNKGFSHHSENVIEHLNKMLFDLEDEYLKGIVTEIIDVARSTYEN
jgi:hypothetical protein